MPMNKVGSTADILHELKFLHVTFQFFIFMLVWCENAGYTASEYNRLLGEFRLVEETIHNTIGFIRDHIQSW